MPFLQDSTIELVPAERNLQVYVSETTLKNCLIDEKFSLEKIIKLIVTDLGALPFLLFISFSFDSGF